MRQPRGDRYVDSRGYVMVRRPDHPASVRGWLAEHRAVMETKLGRQLLSCETVHHVNGKRDDNRPANLELWASSHPAGQRVTELVEWAHEIIARYGQM